MGRLAISSSSFFFFFSPLPIPLDDYDTKNCSRLSKKKSLISKC